MDKQGASGLQDLKKGRCQAQDGRAKSPAGAARENNVSAASHLNGVAAHGQNGGLANDEAVDIAKTNGNHGDANEIFGDLEHLPKLDQSWRKTEANKPLGKLLARLAQQCYADLNSLVEQLSSIPVDSPTQQANSGSENNIQDQSEASLYKKKKLMDWANDQRDRFVKTLILADWARNEEEIAKLIDLKVFLDAQNHAHAQVLHAIGQTKIDVIQHGSKEPNPNIEQASELLATGKASWVPDLGYLPQKPLSAKQLLRTLRNMNVALATRLSLHDELPYHMQQFSIADGRVEFVVPGEFEVDLAVADDDPSSSFFFIDIRFLFTPSPNVLPDSMRGRVEMELNGILASKGLRGCYEFLHNFVLTAKIRTLRDQADKMRRGKWFDCIRVDGMRRIMTIQYWVGMPGPKNWLEIGIASGKTKGVRYRNPPTSCISVRWFRKGAQVPTGMLRFDWVELDMEKCLLGVIAEHTMGSLRVIKDQLHAVAPNSVALNVNSEDASETSHGGKLALGLTYLCAPLVVQREPVTGNFSITPPSAQAANIEQYLNNDPNADPSSGVARVVCAVLQAQIEKLAGLVGWHVGPRLRHDHLAQILVKDVRQHRLFYCSGGWSPNWALLVTIGLGGTYWWVVEVESGREDRFNDRATTIIKSHFELSATEPGKPSVMDRALLLRIEKQAVARQSFTVLAQSLRGGRISHIMEKSELIDDSLEERRRPAHIAPVVAPMFIKFSTLMREKQSKTWKPWAADIVRLTHHGIERDHEETGGLALIRHDLRLSFLPGRMQYLQQHLTRRLDAEIATNGTGGLAIRLLTPFGHPFVEDIRSLLESVERLDSYMTILQHRHFRCKAVSLTKLSFTYSSSPELSAQIVFAKDSGHPEQLKLEPPDTNPHLRIKVMLERRLRDKTSPNPFDTFTALLPLALPLLQTFDKLMAPGAPNKPIPTVHVRTSMWYTLKYNKTPLPLVAFTIRTRTNTDSTNQRIMRWQVESPEPILPAKTVPQGLLDALKVAWQSMSSEAVVALGTSVVADAEGIRRVLEKIDEVVRRFDAQTAAANSHERGDADSESTKGYGDDRSPAKKIKRDDPDVIEID